MDINKEQLIARLRKDSVANGGSYIIPDIVYTLIEEQALDECLAEQKDLEIDQKKAKRIAEANYEINMKLGKEVNHWTAENIHLWRSDREIELVGNSRNNQD